MFQNKRGKIAIEMDHRHSIPKYVLSDSLRKDLQTDHGLGFTLATDTFKFQQQAVSSTIVIQWELKTQSFSPERERSTQLLRPAPDRLIPKTTRFEKPAVLQPGDPQKAANDKPCFKGYMQTRSPQAPAVKKQPFEKHPEFM